MKSFLAIILLIGSALVSSADAQVSESEPNDFFGNANPIDIASGNLTVAGSIVPVGDIDKFAFTVPIYQFVRFESFDASGAGCADGVDTLIRVYDSGGTEIASNDDDGIGLCSSLGRGFAPGTYYVQIDEFGNNATIAGYRLKATFRFESEPNNSFSEANASPLQISGSLDIQAYRNSSDDYDYFRINNATPARFLLKTSDYTGATCFSILQVAVFDGVGVERFLSNSNPCPSMDFSLPAGTFYLRIAPLALNPPANSYVIQVTRIPESFVREYDPNNSFAEANVNLIQVDANLDVAGSISPVGDRDKFRVNLSQGSNLSAETFSDLNGTQCDGIDTVVRLYDSNGAQLVVDDDGGIGQCSLISNLNLPPGIYFVEVEEFGNNGIVPNYLLRTTITHDTTTAPAVFDFDGDGKSDVSIFRPANGQWWINRSSDGLIVHTFGNSGDRQVPGDFTGDGKTDIAVFRPSNGEWFVLRSEDSTFYSFPFGIGSDDPAPGDYDGDGRFDPAVFRGSTATWFIQKSSGGTSIFNFGSPLDKPVSADYDGDGKTDAAIWRPAVGEWWFQKSSTGQVLAFQFGMQTDRPVPGDYTGDGAADVAFWRPASGEWFVLRSEDSSFYSFPFGSSGDVPVPADYDGDGRFDPSVFRPSTATWFLNRSTAGVEITGFGAPTDVPVPSVFIP